MICTYSKAFCAIIRLYPLFALQSLQYIQHCKVNISSVKPELQFSLCPKLQIHKHWALHFLWKKQYSSVITTDILVCISYYIHVYSHHFVWICCKWNLQNNFFPLPFPKVSLPFQSYGDDPKLRNTVHQAPFKGHVTCIWEKSRFHLEIAEWITLKSESTKIVFISLTIFEMQSFQSVTKMQIWWSGVLHAISSFFVRPTHFRLSRTVFVIWHIGKWYQ